MPGRTPVSPTVEPDQDLPTGLDAQEWLLPWRADQPAIVAAVSALRKSVAGRLSGPQRCRLHQGDLRSDDDLVVAEPLYEGLVAVRATASVKNKTRPGEGTCRFNWEAQPPTEVLKGVTGRVTRGRRRSRCNGYRTMRRKELHSERLVDSDQIVRPAGIGPTSNPYRCPRLA